MTARDDIAPDPDEPVVYQIRIEGHLNRRWMGWLGGLDITLEEGGETLLTCPVADQAALHGLLRKVSDLSLPLISVTRVKPGEAGGPDVEPQIEPGYSKSDKQDDLN